ncbi:RNB-domain-containing protein [Epithele typhae]|uniref:RNB-domain-containing protein n=1 Tax=Epithele typhae TaxID=378194 RepID=UPI00200832D6|nr:RNB-domain-containing protein [Epithele typhae]KAH9945352.1 RNB-domain-containing protein [Epithele typhae]
MHKRAIQTLPDVSSSFRRTVARCRSSRANQNDVDKPPKLRSNTPRAPSKHGLVSHPKDGRGLVSQQLRNILSPTACGWLEGKALKSHDTPIDKPHGKRHIAHASQEEAEFVMNDTSHQDSDLGHSGTDVDALQDHNTLPVGTLVKLRKNSTISFGVVLDTFLQKRQQTITILTKRGEVLPISPHDVTFSVPGFVSAEKIAECGLSEVPASTDETRARAEVARPVLLFQVELEHVQHPLTQKARDINFRELVAHKDRNTWKTIALSEAAELLLGKRKFTDIELMAVQEFMLDESLHFLAHTRRFSQHPVFWIRPQQAIEDIEFVWDSFRRKAPALKTFIEKSRMTIETLRERRTGSWGEPPTRRPFEGFQWTDDDRTILRFLISSIELRLGIQEDLYRVARALLIKATGLYDPDCFDEHTTREFLSDLGSIAPWEDPVYRAMDKELLPPPKIEPNSNTPLLSSAFSPSKLYAHDIVESLRHDFGNLPVFVVDDWGAEELDDGVSIERTSNPEQVWLHVHIADPTTRLPPTHPACQDALRQAQSRYFTDRTIRLFQHVDEVAHFSLGSRPGEPDVAMSFSTLIDLPSGRTIKTEVRPSIIRNVQQIKYDDVDIALGLTPRLVQHPFGVSRQHPERVPRSIPEDQLQDMKLLVEVTRALVRRRVSQGALFWTFNIAEVSISPRPLSDDLRGVLTPSEFRGFPSASYSIPLVAGFNARQMIAECMLSAGRAASRFFAERGVPAVRRILGPLTANSPRSLAEAFAARNEIGQLDPYQIIHAGVATPAGTYSTEPGPHHMLGILRDEGYMKVTSPLRRFDDLIAHWQIKHALLSPDRPILFDATWLSRAAESLELADLSGRRLEERSNGFWARAYIKWWMEGPRKTHTGEDPLKNLTGRVVDLPSGVTFSEAQRIRVFVEQLGLMGMLQAEAGDLAHLSMGDEVAVDIKRVDLGVISALILKLR